MPPVSPPIDFPLVSWQEENRNVEVLTAEDAEDFLNRYYCREDRRYLQLAAGSFTSLRISANAPDR
jgi:hypothetical protein